MKNKCPKMKLLVRYFKTPVSWDYEIIMESTYFIELIGKVASVISNKNDGDVAFRMYKTADEHIIREYCKTLEYYKICKKEETKRG